MASTPYSCILWYIFVVAWSSQLRRTGPVLDSATRYQGSWFYGSADVVRPAAVFRGDELAESAGAVSQSPGDPGTDSAEISAPDVRHSRHPRLEQRLRRRCVPGERRIPEIGAPPPAVRTADRRTGLQDSDVIPGRMVSTWLHISRCCCRCRCCWVHKFFSSNS